MLRALRVRTLVVGAVIGTSLVSSTVDAATWDGGGGDNNWTTAANWTGDVAPIANDILQFGGTTRLTPINNFAAGTQFNGIDFLTGAGSFTLGGNGILLGGDINNNSGAAQTINFAPVNVTANGNFTYAAGGLVLDGATSNVNVSAGGSLALGQVSLGAVPQSANVSTLNINNSASASGLTVQTNSAGTNTINIAAGQTFTVNGSVFLGTPSTVSGSGNIPTNVTFAGGGNLVAGGGNFFVGLGSQNFGSADRNVARVDMTALNNFTYSTGTTGTGLFGVGWMTRPDGQLRLSNTANTIIADVIGVGNSGITGTNSSPNNSGSTARLFLGGGTNLINADNINIGAVKGAGSIEWDAAVTTGALTVAAQDGVGRANITIGNQTSATGAGAISTLLLAGHSVNVLANTVQVGRLGGATGGTIGGNVTFDTGTFDVNSLQIAVNASGTANPAGIGVSGAFTMGGGALTVNNGFILGNDTSSAASGSTNATFTLNGGTVTANAPITRVVTSGLATDSALLEINGGTLNMTGKDIASAATPLTAVNLNGGTLANAARIHAAAINIGAPTFSGTPIFVLPDAGTLTSSGLTLAGGQGIEGGVGTGATISGDVTVNSAGRIAPGSTGVAGTLTFNSNLTANNGAVLHFDLSDNPFGSNDLVNVNGNLNAAGTVNIGIGAIGAGATIGQTYTLMNYTGTLTGNQTNFSASDGSRKTYTVLNTGTTPGSIQVSVGGTAPLALTWIGNVNNNWNLNGDANWSGSQKFFNQDTVTFDNTSTNLNDVQLVGDLQPASVTIGGTRNYTFAGTGSITSGGTLTKQGAGTAILAVNALFGGNTTIEAGGTLQIGNGGTTGSLTTPAIVNDGTLRFNRSDSTTFSTPISGTGGLSHAGSGTTTVSSAGTFSGASSITAGILKLGSATALGTADGTAATGTTINGGTLDINNAVMNNTELFSIQGAGAGGIGAIVNNGAGAAANHISRVVLTGNATIGGTGRWDFRGNTPNLDLAGFTLTKIGANQITLVATNVTDGNIVVNEGAFSIETTSTLPAGAGAITFNANTNAQFFQNAANNVFRQIVINGPGVSMGNASTTLATIDSPIELRADLTLAPMTNGAVTNAVNNPLTLTGNITQSGGARSLTKTGVNTVTLTGNLSYTGNTTVSAGTLSLSPLDGTSELADTSTVSVAADAFLNLNFTNTDAIAALILGGSSAATGKWGRVGSMGFGADFESALLTGNGLLQVGAAALPGDFNNDGKVDAADYVVWRKTIGTQAKYDEWRSNFGAGGPGSAASTNQSGAVPEPAAVLLAIVAGALVVAGRRRRV